MDLFTWLTSVTPNDWELVLYFFRIFLPLITLFLWIKDSSFTDLFDRLSLAITAMLSALLGFWCRLPKKDDTADGSGVKFHVTSKVDLPRGQKISRKWLVSWKPVSEVSEDGYPDSPTTGDRKSGGGTQIVYFDPTSGMTFNINTSIQSIGGKELKGGTQNEDGNQNSSPDETDKTK